MGKIHFNTGNFEFLKDSGILNKGEEEIEVSELVERTFQLDKLAQVIRSIAWEVELMSGSLGVTDDYLDKAKTAAEAIKDRKTLRAALEKFNIARDQVREVTKQSLAVAECLDGFKTGLAKHPRKSYERYSETVKTYLPTIEKFAPHLVADANIKIGRVKAIRAIITAKRNDLLL